MRRGDLGEEGIDERGLSNARVARHEEHSPPLLIENGFEGLPQEVHLLAATHQTGRRRRRLAILRQARRQPLRPYLEEKAIAAPDDGLDCAFAEDAPDLTHVRTEKTLAHRDLPPHRLHDLLLSDEMERVLRQES